MSNWSEKDVFIVSLQKEIFKTLLVALLVKGWQITSDHLDILHLCIRFKGLSISNFTV